MFEELAPDNYKFPMLSEKFCAELLDEIERFLLWQATQVQNEVPGSRFLNTRLCVLDHMGKIGPHLLDLIKKVVDRLNPWLFPEVCGETLAKGGTDYRFGFSIGYSKTAELGKSKTRNVTRNALDWHTDDSEISLTIRLGREFTGGGVNLRHLNDDARRGQLQKTFFQKTGDATLFFGQQNHEVEPVTEGERQMLVIWFRSSNFRSKTCPCCRMWRRFGVLKDLKSNRVDGRNCCYDQCVLSVG